VGEDAWTSGVAAYAGAAGRSSTLSRLKRIAPYLLAGPISGPLLAGVIINAREGRPFLATLYAIALVEFVVLLPAFAAKLGVLPGV